jgi:hypothetical protein
LLPLVLKAHRPLGTSEHLRKPIKMRVILAAQATGAVHDKGVHITLLNVEPSRCDPHGLASGGIVFRPTHAWSVTYNNLQASIARDRGIDVGYKFSALC